ncbi:hypothetical protein AvCA_04220 [Azotobacter vinelandii CA]|uniref:Uncharacterized protein n=2 Tax=Azotobacter vinelandii TaxID=354 RepID=C1DJ94_AZOVD|nr:hypothetical protein [Azotobacter vinelandii]ACO76679.1 hypothetical protein Avin_04220 [Azotobacter vinelandii DJ]AGK17306.1 hypothetical protein AvCA_04220 [Azotobacter vinelandii CA]AGK19288.1 hypothetical protein AvCA6_04220 [Azotobacter vinelandii CA6]WKN22430.1 hypothetical protein AVAEIV_000403 [Azotobacter vinelandii]SFX13701.1 hypothetical protein SAMN04244547_00533 [Azotobacter vinelandii]
MPYTRQASDIPTGLKPGVARASNSTRTVADIADDAPIAALCGDERVRWLSALMTAIGLDLEHNEGRRVESLEEDRP